MAEASFPLHRLVWANRDQELDAVIKNGEHDKEELDPRGR